MEDDVGPEKEVPLTHEEDVETSTPVKRKRSLDQTDFSRITREVDEEGPERKKAKIEESEDKSEATGPKKYGDSSLEIHLNRLQAIEIFLRLQTAFPEVAARVLNEEFSGKKPYELTEDEANKAVASVKFLQGVKSTGKINEWAGEITIRGVEDLLCCLTPIKAEGLSIVSKDPDFQELWKEVTIDMMTLSYLDPKARLGLYLAKNLYILHHINLEKEERSKEKEKEK